MREEDRKKAFAFQAEYIRRRHPHPKLTDEEFEALRPYWNEYQAEKAQDRRLKAKMRAIEAGELK